MQIRQQNFMIENKKFSLYSVGATIGRPSELWLNHNFDICFRNKNYWLSIWNFGKLQRATNGRPYKTNLHII